MLSPDPRVREWGREDIPGVLEAMARYCEEVTEPFVLAQRQRALEELLRSPHSATLVVVGQDAVIRGYGVAGYGFSMEFAGRDAFLDELYLDRPLRGGGLGRALIARLEHAATRQGAGAMHLEVLRRNDALLHHYETLGYQSRERYHLMSKLLSR